MRLWDGHTGAPIGKPFTGHADWVRSVVFSPDGTRLASASDDSTVQLWEVHTGAPIGEPLAGHTHYVMSVVFSPDGGRLASASSGKPTVSCKTFPQIQTYKTFMIKLYGPEISGNPL